ncbi:MAG: glutamate--tRNA ligase [Nanoarchaeota archaeon]|nr:glutamate--tRNA ligase [Nanoarchaeota archaeon]
MDDIILKHVLKNAVDYSGKANSKFVIGKILQEKPEYKKNIKNLICKIEKIIEDVNNLTLEEQKQKLSSFKFKKIKIKKQEIPNLKNAKKGKVIMRFAPNPNGALSLGHCRQALWNWFFVKKYKGKFILRFDDTDPKIKVPLKQAYTWIQEDLKWLGIKIDKVIIQSSRLKIYYKYAEQLIKLGKAYICNCNIESWRDLVKQKKSCPCRNLNNKEQLKRWKLMFTSYKEGEAVLRIKTNLQDKNPALRDWPAFRIIDKGKHPLVKSKVWPLLNFASAIDDHELKITHILRGIDLKISDERQKYIYKYFNWKYPETIYTGMLSFSGIKSTSEIKKLIEEGKLTGWDDISLGTIKALRKRGFKSKAISNFIKSLGINKSEIRIDLKNLNAFNKEIIDKEANRYFIVFNPIKIKIKDAYGLKTKIPLHPDFPKRGFRTFKTKDEFYIQDTIDKNKVYRFIHLFNFQNNKFLSLDYNPNLHAKLIHWLPVSKDLVKIEVLMIDKSIKTGLGESSLKNLKINSIIQSERNFFICLNKKVGNKLEFSYLHE